MSVWVLSKPHAAGPTFGASADLCTNGSSGSAIDIDTAPCDYDELRILLVKK